MEFKCIKCNKVLKSKKSYEYHINKPTSCIKNVIKLPIKCKCGSQYYSELGYKMHYEVCKNLKSLATK